MVDNIPKKKIDSSLFRNDDFLILSKIKEYYSYIHLNITNNIPNVHRELKIKLDEESYNLYKNISYALNNKGNIRIKYLTDLLVTCSLNDFLLTHIIDCTKIKRKVILNAIRLLNDIKNMVGAWRNNEETNK